MTWWRSPEPRVIARLQPMKPVKSAAPAPTAWVDWWKWMSQIPGSVATYAQATVSISGSEQANPLPAAYGSGYVDIGGVEGNYQSCTDPAPPRQPVCNTAYDTGTVVIQVGSAAKSASFGNSSTTTATVASALATAFHNDTAGPADGSVSPTNSSRVVLTARSAGSAGNYALSASPVQATAPDFYGTVSGPNFTGGRDASSSPDNGNRHHHAERHGLSDYVRWR